MAETTPGDPLKATVADRLREQAEDEERAAAAQAASERQGQRQEQRKAAERAETLRHTGGALRVRGRRGIAGPRTAVASIPTWVVPAAVVAGLWFARRSKLVLVAGAAVGIALAASRWTGEIESY